ncbi:24898_t:CDS:1, partial [Dentiscutata erythropus]
QPEGALKRQEREIEELKKKREKNKNKIKKLEIENEHLKDNYKLLADAYSARS